MQAFHIDPERLKRCDHVAVLRLGKKIQQAGRHDVAKGINRGELLPCRRHQRLHIAKAPRQKLRRLLTDIADAEPENQLGEIVLF
ncbi:hypothetical protein DSECCO2_599970 [anaerobic digester metagenome]